MSINQYRPLCPAMSPLIDALDNEIIKINEYFQICILSLFSRNAEFSHFAVLQERYGASSSFIKREIILAAKFDDWTASAFLVAAKLMPPSEYIEILKKWTKSRN